jgi:glycosyltransferase involved in cell wall biosynthesis
MHVGVVTPRYPPNVQGGGEISTKMLAEQLRTDPRVDRTTVLTFDGEGTGTVGGVEVRRLDTISSTVTEWQNLRAYGPLSRAVADIDADVLHAYNMELHPAVGLLGGQADVRTVATLNSYHFLRKQVANTTAHGLEALYERVGYPTTGRVLRHLMGRIDRFVALSTTIRDVYADHGLPRGRMDVIPNMYDPSFELPETAPEYEGTTVLYVGELTERKGVDYLVRAFAQLDPEYRLRVVGDGPLLAELRSTAADLSVGDRVTFTGRVAYEEVPCEYAAADVFAHPGVWPEPFSRTVVEAMQAGLPVVSTAAGGHVDVIDSEELVCPSQDPAAMAEAIGHAAAGATEYGSRNRKYVETKLAPTAITERLIDLYERQLGTTHR